MVLLQEFLQNVNIFWGVDGDVLRIYGNIQPTIYDYGSPQEAIRNCMGERLAKTAERFRLMNDYCT